MPELGGRSRELRRYLAENWRKLYRVAFAWTHDRHLADDLTQETIARAMSQRGTFPNERALDLWLFKVLANCHRDYHRRLKHAMASDHEEGTPPPRPDENYDQLEIVQRVRAAVARLGADQRAVVTLVALEGLAYREVADILEIPIGTVMSRLCRARLNLKAYLEDLRPKVPDAKDAVWRVK